MSSLPGAQARTEPRSSNLPLVASTGRPIEIRIEAGRSHHSFYCAILAPAHPVTMYLRPPSEPQETRDTVLLQAPSACRLDIVMHL